MNREENIRQISVVILLVVAVIFSSCAKSAEWNMSKMENGYDASEISSAWTDIGIILAPNAANEYKEVLSFYYDDLIAGQYRYIKSFSGESQVKVSVEFDIR